MPKAVGCGFGVSSTLMEKDSVRENHSGDCINEDVPPDQLVSSPDDSNMYGDPKRLPRVGDQYQVEIPALVSKADYLQLLKKPSNPEFMMGTDFSVGLPMPMMWLHDTVAEIKKGSPTFVGDPNVSLGINGFAESGNNEESKINLNNGFLVLKNGPFCVALDNGRGIAGAAGCELVVPSIKDDIDRSLPLHGKCFLKECRGQDCCSAPGSSSNSWSDFEQKSFLLGIYIFGKNLARVKRFIETKEIGDILSFYYGKFYRSDEYCRWSECRKKRGRRCIFGHRILTGWRQQELLSRLLPCVSEENQKILLEVSRTFAEGKMVLELYVSTLKSYVGMENFMEAVAIGKGKKRDLTGKVTEPRKINKIIPTRGKLPPSGKKCASITSGDIVRFLNGETRLSKTHLNNLFWEAVWPRLLANGWHSEQPKGLRYGNPKNALVFLTPGVEEFTRRLDKGKHYFDTIKDVLKRVASEPRLLEIEVEAAKDSSDNEERGSGSRTNLDEDEHRDHERRGYLQPTNINSDMKFTIVDTSLVEDDDEEPLAIRKLKVLPAEAIKTSSRSRKTTKSSSTASVSTGNGRGASGKLVNKLSGDILSSSNFSGSVVLGLSTAHLNNHKDGSSKMSSIRPNRTIQKQFSRRVKVGQSNGSDPVKKQDSLIACSSVEVSQKTSAFQFGIGLNEEDLHLELGPPDASLLSKICPTQEKMSSSSSGERSSDDSIEGILGENSFARDPSPRKTKCLQLFDLNVCMPSENENGEHFMDEMMESREDSSRNVSVFQPATNPYGEDSESPRISSDFASEEQQADMLPRRQSTRSRPLTTKALEALESGFLNSKGKRKCKFDGMSQDNMIPKPPRKIRRRAGTSANSCDGSTGNLGFNGGEGLGEGCSAVTNLISKLQVQNDRVQ